MVGSLGIYRMLGRGIARCPSDRPALRLVSVQPLHSMLSEQASEDEAQNQKGRSTEKLLDLESPMLGPLI
jgi:hypothetical protein